MKFRILSLFIPLLLIRPAPAALAPLSFDRYHGADEINRWLRQQAQADTERSSLRLHELATSPGDRPLLLAEIGPGAEARPKGMPAILVVANLEGTTPLASEAALFLIRQLLAQPEARRDRLWYILPVGNPDAAAAFFASPLIQDNRNRRPHNDDMDDRVDEDGAEDLDNNGVITRMRVKDPEGEWLLVEGEPRLMKKADPAKGEKGIYKLYPEGVDNDGDGLINEDGPGGVDVGVNFPHLFRYFTADGGPWAGSEAESLGLIRFVCRHPEIAMTITFGRSNFCLTPPRGGRKEEADYTRIKIPAAMGAFLNVDTDRTYTMDEVMEIARNLAPPGMELTESMVAGFLGLGQAVNPLPGDLTYYRELADQYKEFLKKGKLDGARLEPPDARDGSFELWSYYQLGVPTFSMDFWTPPEVKKEAKGESPITPEKLETMSNEEFISLGEEKIDAFLKSSGAPAEFKAAQVIGALKGGMMTTRKMAEMLRQMPKPKDGSGGDEAEQAMLAFSDRELQGKGFVAWKAYRHPTLGDVEIGGFVPYAAVTPPASMIQNLLQGQVPWVQELAGKLPRLLIGKTGCQSLGSGVFRLKVWVDNAGYLPFPTAMGARNNRRAPAVLTLEGGNLAVDQGLKRTVVKEIGGGQAKLFTWIVRGSNGQKIRIGLVHPSGWNDERTIVLGEDQ